jgi:DNA polymerase III delta subunit
MIYWLWGDRYLAEEESKRIAGQMPVRRFDVASGDLSEITADLATQNLFDDARCVILDHFSVTSGRFAGRTSEAARGQLLAALDRLPEGVTLILISEQSGADMRMKFAKAVAERAEPKKLESPGWWANKALADFARSRAAEQGKEIAGRALELIVEEIGADMGRIASEIDKIVLSMDDKEKRITTEHLSVLSGGAGDMHKMASLAGGRDLAGALRILDDLLRQNVQPTLLLARITSTIRERLMARLILDRRGGQAEVAKALGISTGRAHFAMADARKYTTNELQNATHALMRADIALKRGGRPRDVLTLALMAVCGKITARQFHQAVSAYDA